MTLGDLLRQDGAAALLAIGAVIGFVAGAFFRVRARGKPDCTPSANVYAPPAFAPAPHQVKSATVIAAIAAAVSKYQNENT